MLEESRGLSRSLVAVREAFGSELGRIRNPDRFAFV
jgi:hypothetical protein